jgi:imidazolonepropionase-like amidohydrolase
MQMTLPEVIVALTFNALRALGLTSQLGSLETGLCADFVTIEAPLEGLFYDVGYHPVRATYREGQKVDFLKS